MVSGVQVCNYYPGDAVPQVQADAQQAVEEWWLSNAAPSNGWEDRRPARRSRRQSCKAARRVRVKSRSDTDNRAAPGEGSVAGNLQVLIQEAAVAGQ